MARRIFGSALFAIIAGATLFSAVAFGGNTIQTGQDIPEFSFTDNTGCALAISDYKGQVVLVNIWASWCPTCKKELPELNQLANRINGKKAMVLAVNIDEEKKKADDFVGALGKVHFKVGYDPQQRVPEALSVEAMPTSFIVDQKGRVAFINRGYKSGDVQKIEALIEKLLSENP